MTLRLPRPLHPPATRAVVLLQGKECLCAPSIEPSTGMSKLSLAAICGTAKNWCINIIVAIGSFLLHCILHVRHSRRENSERETCCPLFCARMTTSSSRTIDRQSPASSTFTPTQPANSLRKHVQACIGPISLLHFVLMLAAVGVRFALLTQQVSSSTTTRSRARLVGCFVLAFFVLFHTDCTLCLQRF